MEDAGEGKTQLGALPDELAYQFAQILKDNLNESKEDETLNNVISKSKDQFDEFVRGEVACALSCIVERTGITLPEREFVAMTFARHDLKEFVDDPSKISDDDMQTIAEEIGASLSGNDDLSSVIESVVNSYEFNELE